jgi:hypothetical protein
MNSKVTKKAKAKPKKRVRIIDRVIELENRVAVLEKGSNPAVPTPPAVESPEPVLVP